MKKFLGLLIIIASCNTTDKKPLGHRTLETYKAPLGIKASDDYQVEVKQNKYIDKSFVYKSISDDPADEKIRQQVIKGINTTPELLAYYTGGKNAPLDTSAEQSVSWTTFSFQDSVSVVVNNLKSTIEHVKIMPKSKGIQFKITNNGIHFTLNKPQKLAVIINHDYLNPLFIFADALEAEIPTPGTPGVALVNAGMDYKNKLSEIKNAHTVYFEPGVHHIDTAFPVSSNQTIYIPGGAYLYGTLLGINATNVTIRGRGVISGEMIPRDTILAMKRRNGQAVKFQRMKFHNIAMLGDENRNSWNIYADRPGIGCDNLTIEGITIVDPSHFYLRITGYPITVHNVKMVGGWHYNSDGISAIGQDNTTIFDCFFHCNDDAVYINPNNLHVHNCIFWQGNNGSVFQFSWGGDPIKQGGGYIHNCDVIMAGYTSENNNRSVFGSRRSGPGDITDVLFKDIRIEGPVWRVFRINTYARRQNTELASIKNIRFENIDIEGPMLNKNEIISSAGMPKGEVIESSVISDIAFKNVTVGGKPICKNDFILGNKNVEKIVFE